MIEEISNIVKSLKRGGLDGLLLKYFQKGVGKEKVFNDFLKEEDVHIIYSPITKRYVFQKIGDLFYEETCIPGVSEAFSQEDNEIREGGNASKTENGVSYPNARIYGLEGARFYLLMCKQRCYDFNSGDGELPRIILASISDLKGNHDYLTGTALGIRLLSDRGVQDRLLKANNAATAYERLEDAFNNLQDGPVGFIYKGKS